MEVAAAAGAQGPSLLGTLFPFIIMLVIFYFLLIRPQQKRQKQRMSMLDALGRGDEVATIGGLRGTIVELTDDIVKLKVADGVKLTFDRQAINAVINSNSANNNSNEPKDKE